MSVAAYGVMRSVSPVSIAVVVALVTAVRGSAAQPQAPVVRGIMDGIVTDTTLAPLAGATITLFGSSISATTGENGRFRIVALPAGEYVVIARRLGYASASASMHVDGGDTLRPSFTLRRVPPELDTVRTSAVRATTRLSEFEGRRARKEGHFITAAQIDRRNAVTIADALRDVLSVKIKENPSGRVALSARSVAACPFQVFVDGLMFSETGDLTNAPSPREIGGVEIYSGPASIPLQYKRAGTMCGVILIWTRGGL
jgi:hypothetical protein